MLMAPVKTLPFLLSDFLPWSAKIRMGLDFLIPRGDPSVDESIGGFARRRFGSEALEAIIGPIMAGIHAGDPDKLSMRSTFPQFTDMEQKYRSITLGLRALAKKRKGGGGKSAITLFMTLKGGLRCLAEALADRLPKGSLRLGDPMRSLERTPEGRYRIGTGKGEEILADAVILAMPSNKTVELSGLGSELADELLGIPFSSTAVVSMIFSAKDLKKRLDGFGFVVDRREPRTVMAATYTSTKFPGRVPVGKVFIRCFLGGAGREASVAGSDEAVSGRVRQDLKEMLGINAEPLVTRVYRWNGANPQYNVGHEKRVEGIEKLIRPSAGLILAGSSYRGVGIPECVRSGREAAKRLLEATASGTMPPGSVA
jgi:oxygen-dependent protoporphyrinogen oxidase